MDDKKRNVGFPADARPLGTTLAGQMHPQDPLSKRGLWKISVGMRARQTDTGFKRGVWIIPAAPRDDPFDPRTAGAMRP